MQVVMGKDADDNLDLTGCFIDKDMFSIHWINGKMREGVIKASKSAQSFETMCQYIVEYPILCYKGPYPDGSEIKLFNMADKQSDLN